MIDTEPFVTVKEVAQHVGLSESAIRRATISIYNPIPHHRIPGGRAVRYLLSEVSDWMRGIA